MGLGVEKRMALLSGWIEERAAANGAAGSVVTADWFSHTKRWTARLHHGTDIVVRVESGRLMDAMRDLWTATQKRWPNAVTVRVPL